MITHQEVMRALCRRDYAEYVEYVHEGRYIHGRFTQYLCKEVQTFIETVTGNAFDVLLLSTPPQHGKSTTITETLPSWYLGNNPMNHVIEISFNDDFAKKFCRRNNEKIKRFGQELFGITIGYPDTANEFYLTNGVGSMISRGVMSGIVGNPADLLLIDDPIKNRQEADSPTTRENILDEFLNSYLSRLSPGAKVIIIMTRWHKEDLYGYLLAQNINVKALNFPVECEVEKDILGRTFGDALFPEFGKDKKWLESYKLSFITDKGSRAWNALMMGKPTDEEGNIFKRAWFQHYTQLPRVAIKVVSIDASFKEGTNTDNVAIQVWGKIGNRFYGIERVKRNMGFVDTIAVLKDLLYRHSDYMAIYIEDKANGSAIIDVLSRRYTAVIAVNPEGGKVARASAVAPLFEAGNVYIPDTWHEFENEMCDFPNSDYDDEVDACSQALNQIRDFVAEFIVKDPDEWDADDQLNDILNYH
jgi:predicted phage terminase large subunit-like protein